MNFLLKCTYRHPSEKARSKKYAPERRIEIKLLNQRKLIYSYITRALENIFVFGIKPSQDGAEHEILYGSSLI